jgi:hypothetical protein
MIRILTLLIILTSVGCQTAKTTTDYNIEPKPKTITLTVDQDGTAYNVQLTVKTVDGIKCCPTISKEANTWGATRSALDISGFSYKTKALIGDEMVEIDCEPGMRAIVKATPLDEGKVRVKGMYVYNRLQNKDISIPATVIPFNVVVKVGEPTLIYEMKMELEPIN